MPTLEEHERILRDHRKILDDTRSRLYALEQESRDRSMEEARERDERKHEWTGMLSGARATLEQTINAALSPIAPKMQEQTELLKEAAQERMLRKAREQVIAEEAARQAIADAVKARQHKHRLAVAAIIVPLVVALVGLFAAALGSHH